LYKVRKLREALLSIGFVDLFLYLAGSTYCTLYDISFCIYSGTGEALCEDC